MSFHWVKILSVLSKNLKYDATSLFWNDYEAIKRTKKVHSMSKLVGEEGIPIETFLKSDLKELFT